MIVSLLGGQSCTAAWCDGVDKLSGRPVSRGEQPFAMPGVTGWPHFRDARGDGVSKLSRRLAECPRGHEVLCARHNGSAQSPGGSFRENGMKTLNPEQHPKPPTLNLKTLAKPNALNPTYIAAGAKLTCRFFTQNRGPL